MDHFHLESDPDKLIQKILLILSKKNVNALEAPNTRTPKTNITPKKAALFKSPAVLLMKQVPLLPPELLLPELLFEIGLEIRLALQFSITESTISTQISSEK